MKNKKISMALLLVGLIILLAGCGLSSYTQTIMLDPIEYNEGIKLELTNQLGDITTTYNDDDVIKVHATVIGRAESELQAKEVTEAININSSYDMQSNTLILGYEKGNIPFDHRLAIDYKILIPEEFDAEFKTGSDDIRIERMKGNLTANTSMGKLDINNLEGSINSYSRSGNVIINSIKADNGLYIETGTGKVNIGKMELRADTENDIITSTGNIDLKIVENARVEADTFTGNIIYEGSDQGNDFEINIGTGGSSWSPILKLESRTGNINFGRYSSYYN